MLVARNARNVNKKVLLTTTTTYREHARSMYTFGSVHTHKLTFGYHLLEIIVAFPAQTCSSSTTEPLRESPQRVVLVRDLVTRHLQFLSKHGSTL
jgi:hypothetical protein